MIDRILMPPKELIRIIIGGIRYVNSLRSMYKDYPYTMYHKSGDEQVYIANKKHMDYLL